MRPWLVEVEGAELGTVNGPVGFVANRFVLASSESAAIKRALTITTKGWERRLHEIDATTLRIIAGEVRQIGWMHYLTCKRQNRGHALFMEE